MSKIKALFINLIIPGCILSGIAGAVVGVLVFFFKGLVDVLTTLSNKGYEYLHRYLFLIPILILLLGCLAIIQAKVIKKVPLAKGGGIPTSEGIIRGSIEGEPISSIIFTVILSSISYLIGLPFGSEGPSVAIGTSVSALISKLLPKKEKCYQRYIMTGGASAAFAVATGAPITGIIFALEEIHRKFSPMIFLVSFSAVIAGSSMAYLLSLKINISYYMFGPISYKSIGIPLYFVLPILGIVIGLIAVLFNKLIEGSQYILDKKLGNVDVSIKLMISFFITILIGMFIPEFLGGGHSLIEKLMENEISLGILFVLLILKVIMLSWISQSGVTGGMFIPILTIGAIIGAIFTKLFSLEEYSTIFIAMSMVAFMGASIGCSLSALVFAVEALHVNSNILPFAIVVFFAYITTRIFNATHVYDLILEGKLHKDYSHKNFLVIETSVVVDENSFAVGKQARDLLFSANILILQIKRENKDYGKMDNFGEKIIKPNDVVTFRIQTYDIYKTRDELESFLGTQKEFDYDIIQS